MGRWGSRVQCPTCRFTPTKAMVVVILSTLMLAIAYSKAKVHFKPVVSHHHAHHKNKSLELRNQWGFLGGLTILDVTSHLPQRVARDVLNHTILWRLKDDHPPHDVTDILRLERPEYADDFKNPCWKEQREASISVRCLPYFFIAGMQKCGTTDLYLILGRHHQIHLPFKKEPHWWVRKRYSEGVSMETYVKYFDKSAVFIDKNFIQQKGRKYHTVITGDGTASTFWDNSNWQRIAQNCNASFGSHVIHANLIKHILPDAKIIVMFRNPADRLYSAYLYFNRKHETSKDEFHVECLHAVATWRRCVEKFTPRYCAYSSIGNWTNLLNAPLVTHLAIGVYSIYAKEWLSVFPQEQMLFINFHEYSSNRYKVLRDVSTFLDIDPFLHTEFINNLPIKNQRKTKARRLGRMHNETRLLLEEFYSPYNKELASVLQDKRFLFV